VVPVGATLDVPRGLAELVATGSTLFVLGLRFAAPVIAAVLVTNAALAVLGRAAPQLNILSVAFPLQIAVGLMALFASLPLIASFFGGWTGVYDGLLDRVFGALVAR
jgi:flagellar biosynthetic protein FliR